MVVEELANRQYFDTCVFLVALNVVYKNALGAPVLAVLVLAIWSISTSQHKKTIKKTNCAPKWIYNIHQGTRTTLLRIPPKSDLRPRHVVCRQERREAGGYIIKKNRSDNFKEGKNTKTHHRK